MVRCRVKGRGPEGMTQLPTILEWSVGVGRPIGRE
jgi:hypothetical protein